MTVQGARPVRVQLSGKAARGVLTTRYLNSLGIRPYFDLEFGRDWEYIVEKQTEKMI